MQALQLAPACLDAARKAGQVPPAHSGLNCSTMMCCSVSRRDSYQCGSKRTLASRSRTSSW